jgi:hypothetical protein
MRRVALGLCLAAGAGLLTDGEVRACGDKLLVLARHVRSQRAHGAVRRASILVFLDSRGHLEAALREMRLQQDLELAGHTLRMVATPGDLVGQIRSGDHDILLADISEAAALRSRLLAAPGSPALLPVVVNATGDEWAEAAGEWRCISRSPSAGEHYLTVIEEVMRQRQAQKRAKGKK